MVMFAWGLMVAVEAICCNPTESNSASHYVFLRLGMQVGARIPRVKHVESPVAGKNGALPNRNADDVDVRAPELAKNQAG